MKLLAREVRIVIAIIVAGALGLVALIQYTDVCSLQAVTLNGKRVENAPRDLGLVPGRSVLKQPLDSLADALMMRRGITRVRINYRLPNTLQIETNNLLPVCFLLDAASGLLYGVDESGRVVPLPADFDDWEHPILTGTKVRGLNQFCTDIRVPLLVPQLDEIRQSHPTLYPLIQEIEFSNPGFVTVAISGLSYTLKVSAEDFAQRIDRFVSFLADFRPHTDSVRAFDLRYDDMIIQVAETARQKRARTDSSATRNLAVDSAAREKTPVMPVELTAQEQAELVAATAATAAPATPRAKTSESAKSPAQAKKGPISRPQPKPRSHSQEPGKKR